MCYFFIDSEQKEETINLTKMCSFFVSVSHVAPRELLRSLTKAPYSGRKTYILDAFLVMFF